MEQLGQMQHRLDDHMWYVYMRMRIRTYRPADNKTKYCQVYLI